MKNKKTIIISILIFIFSILMFKCNVQANTFEEFTTQYTDEYIKWNNLSDEVKQNTNMPSIYSINLPDEYFESKNKENKTSILGFFKKLIGLDKASRSRYSLTEDIGIEVKNQGMTSGCWAFSILSSMETNMAIRKNLNKQFSERHIVYSTARNFIDGENKNGLNKKVNEFGLHEMALAYLTNGQGAVLEEKMPFEDNEDEIYLSQIDIEKDTYVTEYEKLPSIYKTFDEKGNITYSNGTGIEYSIEEVEVLRTQIKEYIVKYGAIATATYAANPAYYNDSSIMYATAYFCNDNNAQRDHGFTIVGWDDNYSRENFNEKNRPLKDGAYIVLNSYTDNLFDNGYIYVSYEDVIIENNLWIIKDTSDELYSNLYQHDFFGGITYLGSDGIDKGYYANIYERKKEEIEILDYVGVTVPDYVKLNIYVNPNSDSLEKENLIKVASTDTLNPGYQKIKINEIELTSNKFSIVVEQVSDLNRFYFSIEANIPSSMYDLVSSEKQNSKISLDGKNWYNLEILNVDSSLINLEQSDVCIKGFTKIKEKESPYFKSDKYELSEEYVKVMDSDTTFNEFMKNIDTNQEIEVYENNMKISEGDIIKTGMTLKVGEEHLKIVVLGDINADGEINFIDISKLVLHYNEQEILENEYKEAGDINVDGKITLIDISKLIQIYN